MPPDSPFPERSNTSKADRSPTSPGMPPRSLFPDRSNTSSLPRSPNSEGNPPDSPFPERSNISKAERLPIFPGKPPDSSFPDKSNSAKAERPPIADGTAPESRLFGKLKPSTRPLSTSTPVHSEIFSVPQPSKTAPDHTSSNSSKTSQSATSPAFSSGFSTKKPSEHPSIPGHFAPAGLSETFKAMPATLKSSTVLSTIVKQLLFNNKLSRLLPFGASL